AIDQRGHPRGEGHLDVPFFQMASRVERDRLDLEPEPLLAERDVARENVGAGPHGVAVQDHVDTNVACFMLAGMCRNIRVLYNFQPPTTETEIRAAALQYVRTVSGLNAPSAADQEAFD